MLKDQKYTSESLEKISRYMKAEIKRILTYIFLNIIFDLTACHANILVDYKSPKTQFILVKTIDVMFSEQI